MSGKKKSLSKVISEISLKAFSVPCEKYFSFLAKEYGFTSRDLSAAYETVISFEKGNIRLLLFFAIPEVPFIKIEKMDGLRITEEVKHRPVGEALKKTVREFNSIRNKMKLGPWHKSLKEGKFDMLMDAILRGLAEEIRPLIPDFLRGDFSKLKRSR